MSAFEETLGSGVLGAAVLARLARDRSTGTLHWTVGDKTRSLAFIGGRPELVGDGQGRESNATQQVVAVLRALAISDVGLCRFDDTVRQVTGSLGIDTLGQTLVAVVRALPEAQLLGLWKAVRGAVVVPDAAFERYAGAVAQVGGVALTLEPRGAKLSQLVGRAPIETQRSWAALLALGAARAVGGGSSSRPPEPGSRPPTPGSRPPEPAAVEPTPAPQKLEFPEEPKARRAAVEIEKTHRELANKNHYEVLGVPRNASVDTIRAAYFEVARQWHSDRFAGLDMGAEWSEKAEAIFRAAGEAQRVLTDEKERKNFDFILDRKEKGLPTDVNVILEAEGLFQKGQTLVRRGQAAGAEPMLRRAVELNKGEPEFWVYFGYALFCAKGQEATEEAREAIHKGLEMREEMDAGYEFLGRIARVEGNLGEARKQFRKALDINEKNVEAQRELRLLEMRKGKEPDSKSSIGGLLGGLLKKK